MNGVLEQNILEQLEDIQKNLKPKRSIVFTTTMCDCTGECYGDCQGDCMNTNSGDESTICAVYF